MKRTYTVRWEIDIEASSRKDAAKKARAIQQDPTNITTYYNVALFAALRTIDEKFALINIEQKQKGK